MTSPAPTGPDRMRARVGLALGVAALLSIGLAALSIQLQPILRGETRVSGRVFPELERELAKVARITITSPQRTLTLVKGNSGWALSERRDYPIDTKALTSFVKALSELNFVALRAKDAYAAARLGVDDPGAGGTGTHIEIQDATGQPLHDFYLRRSSGTSTAETGLLRLAGGTHVYEVKPNLPEIDNVAFWLNLRPVEILPETIASVRVETVGDKSYDIVRRPDGGFAPVGAPANPVVTATALALTQLEAQDVRAMADVTAQPAATHTTTLRTDLSIRATLYAQPDGICATLLASANEPQGQSAATSINQAAGGWCYVLPSPIAESFLTSSPAVLGAQ